MRMMRIAEGEERRDGEEGGSDAVRERALFEFP